MQRLLAHTLHLRAAGLALLLAGILVALLASPAVGLALVGASSLPLALSHPLVVQRARLRAGRRAAPRNGHPGTSEPEDVGPPR